MAARTSSRKKPKPEDLLPSAHDWRTTDEQEVLKRQLRAREEKMRLRNESPEHPVFSNFEVRSESGLRYRVEIRDVTGRQFSCTCADFRKNGLGTCKHVEAVLIHARQKVGRRVWASIIEAGSDRVEVGLDNGGGLRLWHGASAAPKRVRALFDAATGQLRREYEQNVQSGAWPAHETLVPLFPYQREGMLHLAFTERALLADEMGLGKTIQAIAACALLHRLGKARRVLVVTPASLKTEWEEQIAAFTTLLPPGFRRPQAQRLACLCRTANGAVLHHRQLRADGGRLARCKRAPPPDVVVLDEAQRIKNWSTKTAQAIKRLRSRYAFVLTGTPIENRIDELHSLMDFLDPACSARSSGSTASFMNSTTAAGRGATATWTALHSASARFMLRRRKAEVETELPERTDRNHFVPSERRCRRNRTPPRNQSSRAGMIAKRRPLQARGAGQAAARAGHDAHDLRHQLHPRSQDRLPETDELGVLEECRANDGRQGHRLFRMGTDARAGARPLPRAGSGLRLAHRQRPPAAPPRLEINAFKNDPACRVFLSTDSGATGLNLQNASVVINCDLPWNPAKLEQRIARAWRKHQTRPVTVINLISENTIEHRMLGTLAPGVRHPAAAGRGRVGDLRHHRYARAVSHPRRTRGRSAPH
jgi:hypothetical protein